MKIYCLEDFHIEFKKLKKKNNYKNLEEEIIDYFFNKEIDALKAGTRLNNSDTSPTLKRD